MEADFSDRKGKMNMIKKKTRIDIKIRNVDKDILYRLDVLARRFGFRSRQEYLLHVLTRLALEEVQLEADLKYNQLLSHLKDLLQLNTEALNENRETLENMFGGDFNE